MTPVQLGFLVGEHKKANEQDGGGKSSSPRKRRKR